METITCTILDNRGSIQAKITSGEHEGRNVYFSAKWVNAFHGASLEVTGNLTEKVGISGHPYLKFTGRTSGRVISDPRADKLAAQTIAKSVHNRENGWVTCECGWEKKVQSGMVTDARNKRILSAHQH